MKHSPEYLMRCIPARAGALLETDKWTIWLNNSCWWKPLWVSNYACFPQSQLCPPRLLSSAASLSRQTAQSLADTRGKNIKLERKKLSSNYAKRFGNLKWKLFFVDWWKEFRWINEFYLPLFLFPPVSKNKESLNCLKFWIWSKGIMQWLSLLSNQIKIKTNVGRTGLSERATDPQYPMSPDTAPDINIVNQIGEDEDTWKCLTFGCLKSWENACIQ